MIAERLALRVPGIAGEPAHGLAMGLAERHRRGDVAAFVRACGVDHRGLLAGRGVTRLASLAAVDADVLARWTPAVDPVSRTVRLGHALVSLGDWSIASRRWCVACLREDRASAEASGEPTSFHVHHRCWWDVRSITSCQQHGAKLMEACTTCGRLQGWCGVMDRCVHCGTSLLAAEGEDASTVVSDAFLRRLIEGVPGTPTCLDTLFYHETVHLLDRLGAIRGWSRLRPAVTAFARAETRDRGLAILKCWPNGFVRVLDEVLEGSRTRAGLARYGWIYEFWIKDLADRAWGSELREALRDHAVANAVVPVEEPCLGHRPLASTVSATQAAERLGMGYSGARRRLAREGLIAAGARRGVAFPVALAHLSAVAKRRGHEVGLAGISTTFGVARGQARLVASAARIRSERGRYDDAAARRYVARLRSRARPFAQSSRTMPLPTACKAVGVPLQTACASVSTGRLRVAVGAGRGLAGLHVVASELRVLSSHAGMSVERAAAALGVHHQTARALVSLGHLSRGTSFRGIDVDDVTRFGAVHVPATELARALGTSPRGAIAMLRSFGVEPVIGPPSCRAVFTCAALR